MDSSVLEMIVITSIRRLILPRAAVGKSQGDWRKMGYAREKTTLKGSQGKMK